MSDAQSRASYTLTLECGADRCRGYLSSDSAALVLDHQFRLLVFCQFACYNLGLAYHLLLQAFVTALVYRAIG